MQEIDRVKELREQIANRLALDFFVRCLHLPKGITVIDEAREEADGILSLKIDGTTLKELIEDNTKSVKAILNQMALERCDPDVMAYFEDYYWLSKSVWQAPKRGG